MLKIAITGNIASGKSLFEQYLKEYGFKVLCLDEVTHNLYKCDNKLQDFLLRKMNTINRGEVSKIVFSNPCIKKELEDFIYPLIFDKMQTFFVKNSLEKFIFVSAALLFEASFDKFFDKIVFINVPYNLQLQRLIQRNNLSESEALARIHSQGKIEEKIKLSDYIINNSGSKADLKQETLKFIEKIKNI